MKLLLYKCYDVCLFSLGRFRQTEVLATVANVFSEIYSHVSGRPLEKICQMEPPPKESVPLRRNSSALNAVKILKRNITRPNLLSSSEGTPAPPPATDLTTPDPEGQSDSDSRPAKAFKKRDSVSLETVTEESSQGTGDVCSQTTEGSGARVNGDTETVSDVQVLTNWTKILKHGGGTRTIEASPGVSPEKQKKIISTSSADKEPGPLLPNPHMAHLLTQPRDSFEMEEVPVIFVGLGCKERVWGL